LQDRFRLPFAQIYNVVVKDFTFEYSRRKLTIYVLHKTMVCIQGGA